MSEHERCKRATIGAGQLPSYDYLHCYRCGALLAELQPAGKLWSSARMVKVVQLDQKRDGMVAWGLNGRVRRGRTPRLSIGPVARLPVFVYCYSCGAGQHLHE